MKSHPVLCFSEAIEHPHNEARISFVQVDRVTQPAPSPKFSRTNLVVSRPPAEAGAHINEIHADWGFASEEIEQLNDSAIVRQAQGDADPHQPALKASQNIH